MTIVIYPLNAGKFRFVAGPVGYLTDTDFVRRIDQTDFELINNHMPAQYIGVLDSPLKCFYSIHEQQAPKQDEIFSRAGLIAFTLNYFGAADALEFPCAILLRNDRRRAGVTFLSQPGATSLN